MLSAKNPPKNLKNCQRKPPENVILNSMTPEPIPQPPETPQSAPNPCCPHPKSHPIIFLLIAILLTAVGVYAGMQLEKRKVKVWVEPPLTEITPEPTQITDSTANWKIYANTTYGFEFKYPKEWIIFQNDESAHVFLFLYSKIY